jgi:hypothetical protein
MESSTAAAPAISLERILPNLQEYCFSERTVGILQRERGFEELSHILHRIYFVNEFAQRNDGHALSLRQLSREFECDAARVKAARVRIITFASHTTHIFQMLDVVLFGALKKHANGLKMFDEE